MQFRVVAVSVMPQRVVVGFSALCAFSIFEHNIYAVVSLFSSDALSDITCVPSSFFHMASVPELRTTKLNDIAFYMHSPRAVIHLLPGNFLLQR